MKRLNDPLRAEDVTDGTISRIDARLDALESSVSAIEAHLPFAKGQATLSTGTVDVPIPDIPPDAWVQLTYTAVSSPGFLSYVITTDTLTINSDNASDKGTVTYLVIPA